MPLSNSSHFVFTPSSQKEIELLTSERSGETKIGQRITFGKPTNRSKFILLGIEESAGPQANFGLPGAENGFSAFLKRFLNMQSNRFLEGDEIIYIGSIQRTSLPIDALKKNDAIEELDELVVKTLLEFMSDGLIPIVIGGGHNNAFPLIKALSILNDFSINVVNFDPHADCRALEGRHSGNPFSYAKAGGFLNLYTVLGLHKAYNSEFILKYLESQNFTFTFFDDYLDNSALLFSDIDNTSKHMSTSKKFGIELDMDAIQLMPSSAFSPSGITLENARYYIKSFAKLDNCCYLHIPEGAPTNLQEEKIVGKALAYLVWDFITTQVKK